MPPALVASAAAQWGVFSAVQALVCGLTRADLARLAAAGYLTVPHPDVYVIAGARDTPEQRLWISYLSVGEPCAFAGRTAGWLLGLPGCKAPLRPELVVPGNRRPRSRCADVRRLAWWPRAAVEVDAIGLPRLSLRDTLTTAAPNVPVGALLSMIQEGVFTGRLSTEEVRDELRRGLPGGLKLGLALDKYDRGHDSAPEAQVYRTLSRGGLPPDHCNVSVHAPDGSLIGPFDGYYEVGIAYEYDGREVHDKLTASRRDATKAAAAGQVTVRVVRLTKTDLRDPDRLLRRMGAAVRPAVPRPDLIVVHAGNRACVCGWAPGTTR